MELLSAPIHIPVSEHVLSREGVLTVEAPVPWQPCTALPVAEQFRETATASLPATDNKHLRL